jgi:hypothetical protein
MPLFAWVGILVSLLVAVPVLYFAIRSLITLFAARKDLERPHPGAGVVEIGDSKPKKRVPSPKVGPKVGAGRGRSDEDRAMQEALEKLERRSRSSEGSESRRRTGEQRDSRS